MDVIPSANAPHIISIPHTGTRSVLALFNMKPGAHSHTHIETKSHGQAAKLAITKHDRVVIPLRDPRSVLDSWSKRNRRYINNPNSCGADYFTNSWEILFYLAWRYEPMLLPVDHADRDLYLERILSRWNCDTRAGWNWQKITDQATTQTPQPIPIDLTEIYSNLAKLGVYYEA